MYEEEMLMRIKGLKGVPKLIEAWSVWINGIPDITANCRTAAITAAHPNSIAKMRVTLRGKVVRESSVVALELVVVLELVPNEIAMQNEEMREKFICEKALQSGLLIDFDYATLLEQNLGASPRNCTTSHGHTLANDLESLIYVLVWICVLYVGPNGQLHRDKVLMETALNHHGENSCVKLVISKLYSTINRGQNSSNELTHQAVRDILLKDFVTIEEDKNWDPFKYMVGYRLLQSHVGSKCKLPSYATVGYEEDNCWNVHKR
ncbi:hypothetical protein BDN67DRAFT_984949 [Paxillus ammoniavirescens]|nr:hypothetical protein BDN67DRAFT_984949 [Paxillus ammoniavirescens]